MKLKYLLGWSSALCLSALVAQAQETNEVERLSQRLKQIQDTFDKQQREMKEMLQQQQAEIQALKQQLASSTNVLAGTAQSNAASAMAVSPEQLEELNTKVDGMVEAQKQVRPGAFNPSIGLVGETVFSYISRGSDQTGSSRPGGWDVFQRSIELNVAAAVDPFAKGYAVINASADAQTGEANLGVEEAAIQTTSLPWNLELKAGRFFGEFGKLSYIHDHELPFVNRPMVLDQYIGGESRTDGAQLSWLLPTAHYVSLTTGFGVGFGGDSPLNNPGSYRSLSGFNYFGRLSTCFDVTPNVQLETGISGLINPNEQDRGGVLAWPGNSPGTQVEQERRVAGLDVKLSYVPLRNNQFQRLDWGTEVLYSDSRYLFDPDGIPGNGNEYFGDVGSLGLYSYVTYKWSRQWSAGFLFDYAQNAQNHDEVAFAYSPYLTFALSHWNQLRLQYTHTDCSGARSQPSSDAVYLQWAWIIGAHSHGWQAR